MCKDVTIYISGDDVTLRGSDADDGSYDPNDRELTFQVCDNSNFCSPGWTFDCSDIGGTYSFILRVDNGLSTSTCDFTLEVEQGTPGDFACPEPVTVQIGDCMPVVQDGDFYFNDDGGVRPEFEPQSYPACNTEIEHYIIRPDNTIDSFPVFAYTDGLRSDTFGLGTSTVVYTARYEDEDAVERTQSCSFTVTVEPAGLTLDCPNNAQIDIPSSDYDPENPCFYTVEDQFNAEYRADLDLSYNGCGDITYRVTGPGLDPAVTEGTGELTSFNFEAGISTVEYTLVRIPGEEYTCSFTVEIDAPNYSLPEFTTCPQSTVELTVYDGITEQEVIDQLDFEVIDDCGIVRYELENISLSCSETGSRQRNVRLRAYDARLLEDICTFDVITRAGQGVNCPADVTVNVDPETCQATIGAGLFAPAGAGCGENYNYLLQSSDNTSITSGSGNIPEQVLGADAYTAAYSWTERVNGLDVLASCSFTVTVRESEAPAATCQDMAVNLSSIPPNLAELVGAGSSDNCSGSLAYALSLTPDCTNIGLNPAFLTVTDGSGNQAICQTLITVVNDIAPAINECPPTEATVNMDAGACQGAVPDLTGEITGASDCGSITPYQLPLAGTAFGAADGDELQVEVGVIDDDGNASASPCTVTLTLQDMEAPTALCQDLAVQLDEAGSATVAAQQIDNGSSDNCSIASLSLSQAAFDCNNIGDNTVTLTATDAAGKTGTCTATVTVEDNLPPALTCRTNIQLYLDGTGTTTWNPNGILVQSSDNCSIASTVVDPLQTFTCADLGDNFFTLKQIDVSGNESECTAKVVLTDISGPTVVPQNITVELDEQGQAVITAADADGGSSDNCTSNAGLEFFFFDLTAGEPTADSPLHYFDCNDIGTVNLILGATDAEGNIGASLTPVTVTVNDNEAPTFTDCPEALFYDSDPGQCGAVVEYLSPSANDNCGATVSLVSGIGNSGFYPVGTTTESYTATDAAGHTAGCSFTVTVTDNEAPVARCRDITVELGANGSASIAAVQVNDGSSDNCNLLGLNLSRTSFGCSDVGMRTVLLTATDPAGNSHSCTATVIVQDKVAPAAVCRDITVQLDESGQAAVLPEDIGDGSTDACGIASLALSQTAFTCADLLGPNAVTLTATDVNGNASGCAVNVWVRDDNFGACPDPCPNDPDDDLDGDGICGDTDNCPAVFNP
ncbi:MAG: HYR domain-containing protein, partial [Phaeodactylibacter sp.]|nr:HYR domain-containing protein [Phaeodactylibacter sp.]